jgi:hypothetical protein
MKTYCGNGGKAPPFLALALNGGVEVSGQIHTPAGLLPGKQPTVQIVLEVGWTQEVV